jgi:hypothetical protein
MLAGATESIHPLQGKHVRTGLFLCWGGVGHMHACGVTWGVPTTPRTCPEHSRHRRRSRQPKQGALGGRLAPHIGLEHDGKDCQGAGTQCCCCSCGASPGISQALQQEWVQGEGNSVEQSF